MADTELPIRIIAQHGGAVIRCLCGRELAQIRRGSAAASIRPVTGRYTREVRSIPLLSPDITAHGLAIMVAHALTCKDAKPDARSQTHSDRAYSQSAVDAMRERWADNLPGAPDSPRG